MRVDKRKARQDIYIDNQLIIKKGTEVITSSIEEIEGKYVITVFSSFWFKDEVSKYELIESDIYSKRTNGCTADETSINYLSERLKYATNYGLLTEVVAWSLMHAQSNKSATIKECVDYGINEWIK